MTGLKKIQNVLLLSLLLNLHEMSAVLNFPVSMLKLDDLGAKARLKQYEALHNRGVK